MWVTYQVWKRWGRKISPLEILQWPGWLVDVFVQFDVLSEERQQQEETKEQFPWAEPGEQIIPLGAK